MPHEWQRAESLKVARGFLIALLLSLPVDLLIVLVVLHFAGGAR